jgi:hypothetical protein
MVTDAINSGRSIINYCGHGTNSRWTTSHFNIQKINELENNNMLPFIINVACHNGQFDVINNCFCEAWLRATNNGEPTGAVAASGSSIFMSWKPAMDGQDEMIDLIIESYEENIKHTIGGIHFNGIMHMNDEYAFYAWLDADTWHVFGDPSLQLRTATPVELSVIHQNEINEFATSYELLVENVENALCAISRNSQILGSAYTDNTGKATIYFNEPLTGNQTLDLVITSYNSIAYLKEITVKSNKPPFKPNKPIGPTKGKTNESLTYSTSTSDPNGNQILYMWDWGDGNQSEWMGPFESDEIINASWIWSNEQVYKIKVKSKDIYDYESEWSDPLDVSIPRNNNVYNNLLKDLFYRIINLISFLKNFNLILR